MAFTKIQPQQLQLPTFTSPSGDFSLTDLSTGFQINLERDIDGPIDFNGSATIDDDPIITTSSTNSIADSCSVLGGINNVVTGTNNVIVNGSSNTNVSGNFNTLLNGTLVDFGASGQRNTILAGRLATFADQTTGAVILAGHEGSATNSTNHSLLVSFNSGVTFQEGDVNFNSNLRVDSSHTGIFNGNCQFNTGNFTNGMSVGVNDLFAVNSLGNIEAEGDVAMTEGDLTVTLGNITATAGNIVATAGNITATAGGIIAEVGNITATDGNIVAVDGNVTAPNILASEDLGYSSGGVSAAQTSGITNAIALNAPSGKIICFPNNTYAAGVVESFTFDNNTIGPNDVVVVSMRDGDVNLSVSVTETSQTGSGSCRISIYNNKATDVAASVTLNFVVIKASIT